jgi:hypothetical protein
LGDWQLRFVSHRAPLLRGARGAISQASGPPSTLSRPFERAGSGSETPAVIGGESALRS